MGIVLSVLLGLSLSAASGFRVFVPFLVISIASKAGFVELSGGFSWIGSTYALIIFAVATVLEIVAYYVPYVDNFLDAVAMPIAIIAGTVLTATVITDMSPMLKWTLAIIAGGGISAAVHATTTVVRGTSTAVTAGLGNNVITTLENISSTLISIFAVVAPIIALVVVAIIVVLIISFRRKRNQPSGA